MLKILACLLMLIDHIGYYFSFLLNDSIYMILRSAGRLAFPIFAFLLAKGFYRTGNLAKYIGRIFVFSIISQIVIMLSEKLAYINTGIIYENLNILFLFTFSLILMACFDVISGIGRVKINFNNKLLIALSFIVGAAVILLVYNLDVEYSIYGLMVVMGFYFTETYRIRFDSSPKMINAAMLITMIIINCAFYYEDLAGFAAGRSSEFPIQVLSVLAVPFMWINFSDKRPSSFGKYMFYIFYPGHIALLCIARRILLR